MKKMKKFIFILTILSTISICCFSQNKNDDLHEKCMFDDEYCKNLAMKGNAVAQNALGLKFEMTENYTEALKWYNKSALQGNASACNNIGTCYFYGYSVEINYLIASNWYKKAIEKGYTDNTTVYRNLAYCYYYNGKNQNLKESFTWFRKAADQKDLESKYMISIMYENGLGIAKDLTMAFTFYKEAATNYIPAMYALAICYYMGTGVEKNYIEAVKWFRKCATHESTETATNAQFALGVCYLNGQGVEKNLIEAEKWIDIAANNGQLIAIEYNKNKAPKFGLY